jgi:hypothetical protein
MGADEFILAVVCPRLPLDVKSRHYNLDASR